MDYLYKKLKEFGRVKANEALAKHATFKIGGPAQYLIAVEETDKLVGLLNFLSGEGEKFFVIGGGSNLLFPDDGFLGVVIKIKTAKVAAEGETIEADAGVALSVVVNEAVKSGLAGMEWGVGIPGTVGGAARGNAGAMGQDMSGVMESVRVWRDGEVLDLPKSECGFGYRDSAFKKNSDVILSARLRLRAGDQKTILELMQKYLQQRTSRISVYPSGGSFFKNVKVEKWRNSQPELEEVFHKRGKIPAGWLIEQAGCADLKSGGAEVSDLHANIIVNRDGASQADVLNIVEDIKKTVYNKFGVELEEEVEIVK